MTHLGHLLEDPETRPIAIRRIKRALSISTSLADAAAQLGITYRSLCRLRERLPGLIPDGEPGNPTSTRAPDGRYASIADPRQKCHGWIGRETKHERPRKRKHARKGSRQP